MVSQIRYLEADKYFIKKIPIILTNPNNDDFFIDLINKINCVGTEKPIRELSGDQSKFVQILASILKLYTQNGKILILDEPSNILDTGKVKIINSLIISCIHKNIIIFIITHDNRLVDNLIYDTVNSN